VAHIVALLVSCQDPPRQVKSATAYSTFEHSGWMLFLVAALLSAHGRHWHAVELEEAQRDSDLRMAAQDLKSLLANRTTKEHFCSDEFNVEHFRSVMSNVILKVSATFENR